MNDTLKIADSRSFCVRALHGRGTLGATLRTLLRPASWVYGGIGAMRRRAYGMGLLRTHKLPIPVLSIGNITAGGTGKTPMVEWVVRALQKIGHTPAILSRGYGGLEGGQNDEALILSANLPGIIHIANPNRVEGGQKALEAGADCLVLDDGFQHMRLHRDLNIVLIDALNPFGGGAILPSGLLREPLGAIRAADAIVITHADAVEPATLQAIRDQLKARCGETLIAEAAHRPTGLDGPDGATLTPDAMRGKKVFLFCGIGNPDGFHGSIRRLGAEIVGARNFQDHHAYTPNDLREVVDAAREAGAEMMVTTQKDTVKIPLLMKQTLPAWVLRIEFDIRVGDDYLLDLIRRECAS
jgi:tetraacyldisaccharide 4'-kinase